LWEETIRDITRTANIKNDAIVMNKAINKIYSASASRGHRQWLVYPR